MPRSCLAASGTHRSGRASRAGVLAVAAAVAFGVVLGPVSAASADTAVTSVADLATAFLTQASGSTITLDDHMTGNASSPAVEVPAGRALTLDLSGHRLTLVSSGNLAGLRVPAGTSLTIIDSAPGGVVGALSATGYSGGAGIGGHNSETSGTITINGGSITAAGGFAGAGIGGGWDGDAGTITINGGTITATGGDMAAAIGGGHSGDAGTIAINGGTVTAHTPTDAAAIGGGVQGAGGSVSIGAGATVTASGTESVIGRGGSANGESFGTLSNAGTLNIPALSFLEIGAGMPVTNSGTINLKGFIFGDGTLVNSGTILGSGTIYPPVTVTGHNATVVLDGSGGIAPANPAVVYSGTFQDGQIAFPADATRAGYTFAGWFTQVTGGTKVIAVTDLGLGGPKSMTLYAQWNTTAPPGNGSTPSAGPGATTLPVTGSDPVPIGLVGSALILIGLAVRLRLRRRQVTVR